MTLLKEHKPTESLSAVRTTATSCQHSGKSPPIRAENGARRVNMQPGGGKYVKGDNQLSLSSSKSHSSNQLHI